MSSQPAGRQVISATIRGGHPDFLDLPWHRPLAQWADHTQRFEELPRGLSRHPVVFISYNGVLYALKQLPPPIAEREFSLLREMEERRLPAVTPVGHMRVRFPEGEDGIVITRYLDRALPYYALFMGDTLVNYRDHMLDAIAVLLVQLHLGGVYWGDCSLNNTLFRRDAGRLNAYLVDAETSEIHQQLTPGQRSHDLDLMEENIFGGLLDLEAVQALPRGFRPDRVGKYVRERYDALWNHVTREQIVPVGERYQIRERVKALNDLGFSVDQIQLITTTSGQQLRLRAGVTDRFFHRDMLHSLTGLLTEEMQARTLLNEIEQSKATLSAEENRSVPLTAAAYRWFQRTYMPAVERLTAARARVPDPVELYCQVLEHKWYMSERARADVGHEAAVDDFLKRFGMQPTIAYVAPPLAAVVSKVSRSHPTSWWRRMLGRVRRWRSRPGR